MHARPGGGRGRAAMRQQRQSAPFAELFLELKDVGGVDGAVDAEHWHAWTVERVLPVLLLRPHG